jgi:protein-S-isoprenylcysteine O-methyltransferase Ste14
MRKRIPEILAAIAVILALFGLFFQRFSSSHEWFNWEQLWNYESLIGLCVVAAVALVAGKYLGRR